MKKNHNVRLVTPAEGAEKVRVSVNGHEVMDRSNYNH